MIESDFHPGIGEECGVFGIFAKGRTVANNAYFGIYALQHRGQESAGIVSCDGVHSYDHKGVGLVSRVFDETAINGLKGHMAIGHTRYSTTGSNHVRNVQPYLLETIYGPLAIAHNGNLTNALELRYKLLQNGTGLSSTSDSELLIQALAQSSHTWDGLLPDDFDYTGNDRWTVRLRALMEVAEGAFSLTVLTKNAIYGVRDPLGLRPLCIGMLDDGYVLASESCALQTIGADYLREVMPGEVVRIDENGLHSAMGKQAPKPAMCIFEYVYFARPDSNFEGQSIHQVRQKMGRQLAKEAPVAADLVIPVPDSAFPAAIGFSLESGIPFSEGLTKNRYIGRTFIQPDDQLRKNSVKLKYNVLSENLRGKRVVLVDDSIVRGNTAGPLVQLLREGGAAEVHVRVSSPPVAHPCFMGVDMATYGQLIAHKKSVAEICEHIGADSLHYLTQAGMEKVVREDVKRTTGHCSACFSGEYPIPIPAWLFEEDRDKVMFEGVLG
jgi:amidophosphoribosyltransferase